MIRHYLSKAAGAFAVALGLASGPALAGTINYTEIITWEDSFQDQEFIGGAFINNFNDTMHVDMTIINGTSDTWKSFILGVRLADFEEGSFAGPAGSFAIIDNDPFPPKDTFMTIGGIMIAPNESLAFTVRTGNFDINFAQMGFIPYFGTDSTESVPNPIPLPAAAWLLIGGLGALGAVARKRAA